MNPIASPEPQTELSRTSDGSVEVVPDAQKLQAQFAAQSETECQRPFLQLLQKLMSARSVVLLPKLGEKVLVGAAWPGLGKLSEAFDPEKAMALPAPLLGADGYTLVVPLYREKQHIGWLAAQLTVPSSRDLQAFIVLVQGVAGYLIYHEQRKATGKIHGVLERTSAFLDLFRRVGSELDFSLACRQGLDALCADIGCSRATLGLKRRGAVRTIAISGTTQIDPKSLKHQPYEAAMREALIEGNPVDFTPETLRTDLTAAHEMLHEKTGTARLLTLPLPHARGAIVMEWNAPPDSASKLVSKAASPFIPALFGLLDRARPNPALFAAQRFWKRASENRRRTIAGIATAIGILLILPFHYRITADCRIVPTVKRVIAAPFDGQLRKSFVRPGDKISEGEALGELDNRELKLKEAELAASQERAFKQRDRAMSNADKDDGADYAAAQVAGFEAQSIGLELELVRRRLEMLDVKAPISGVVVSGDLRRAEGLPVPRGQILWEVAPLDAMIVEIDVPDREVSRVSEGQPVYVKLEAFGGGRWESTIQRVHPQSEQRDGKNVFIAEADIATSHSTDLRPGMRGRAIIESGRRPLIWILAHKFRDWLVTTLFW